MLSHTILGSVFIFFLGVTIVSLGISTMNLNKNKCKDKDINNHSIAVISGGAVLIIVSLYLYFTQVKCHPRFNFGG